MEARALSTMAIRRRPLDGDTGALAADKVFDRSFDVPSSGRLNIEFRRWGESSDRRLGHVARRRAPPLPEGSDQQIGRVTWSAEKDAAGVSVTVKHADGNPGWFSLASARPRERRRSKCRARSMPISHDCRTSQIEVRGLNGNVTGKTSGGRIHVEDGARQRADAHERRRA